jgi:branched-chain amino acid transport system ATP-binding protein
MPERPMLELKGASASYGSVPAISNVSIAIGEGEAVGLLGANGAGKSTTLRAISGLVKLSSGSATFAGADLAKLPPYRIPELGIAHVPEGRQVFPEMTVNENLEIGAYVPKAKAERARTLDLVYSIFPRLAERKKQLAGTMSGGEQQMLAVGRGLMLKPKLLMLDEPSLGLAPLMVDEVMRSIRVFRESGVTVFLVEQNANLALRLADRAYVMETGKITMTGSGAQLLADERVRASYLGAKAPSHRRVAQTE